MIFMEFPDVRAVLDYKNVEAYLAKQLPKATWNAAVINLVLYLIILGIAYAIALLLHPVVLGLFPGIPAGNLAILASSSISLTLTIEVLVMAVVGFFILGGILHIIAKAFGGKGSLVQLLYLISLANLALVPLSFVLILLNIIPYVSCISGICSLALAVYFYYLYYCMLKVAYKLDSNKAILTVAAFVALMIVLSTIIVLLFILARLSELAPTAVT
jgi:hypothetical protein